MLFGTCKALMVVEGNPAPNSDLQTHTLVQDTYAHILWSRMRCCLVTQVLIVCTNAVQPKFLSKKQREEAAMARRKEEVEMQRSKWVPCSCRK
jgi:hypothetical protein